MSRNSKVITQISDFLNLYTLIFGAIMVVLGVQFIVIGLVVTSPEAVCLSIPLLIIGGLLVAAMLQDKVYHRVFYRPAYPTYDPPSGYQTPYYSPPPAAHQTQYDHYGHQIPAYRGGAPSPPHQSPSPHQSQGTQYSPATYQSPAPYQSQATQHSPAQPPSPHQVQSQAQTQPAPTMSGDPLDPHYPSPSDPHETSYGEQVPETFHEPHSYGDEMAPEGHEPYHIRDVENIPIPEGDHTHEVDHIHDRNHIHDADNYQDRDGTQKIDHYQNKDDIYETDRYDDRDHYYDKDQYHDPGYSEEQEYVPESDQELRASGGDEHIPIARAIPHPPTPRETEQQAFPGMDQEVPSPYHQSPPSSYAHTSPPAPGVAGAATEPAEAIHQPIPTAHYAQPAQPVQPTQQYPPQQGYYPPYYSGYGQGYGTPYSAPYVTYVQYFRETLSIPQIRSLLVVFFISIIGGSTVLILGEPVIFLFPIFFIIAFTFPSFIWISYVYHKDILEPESKHGIFIALTWGMFSTLFAIFPNTIALVWLDLIYPSTIALIITAVVVAPFNEEFFKPLGIRRVKGEINSELDGLIYGVTCGMGFAIIENFSYELTFLISDESPIVIWTIGSFIRGVGSTIVHAVGAGLIGFTYARIRIAKRRNSLDPAGAGNSIIYSLSLIGAYLVAVGLHAGWNGSASIPEFFPTNVGVILSIIGHVLVFATAFHIIKSLANEGIRRDVERHRGKQYQNPVQMDR